VEYRLVLAPARLPADPTCSQPRLSHRTGTIGVNRLRSSQSGRRSSLHAERAENVGYGPRQSLLRAVRLEDILEQVQINVNVALGIRLAFLVDLRGRDDINALANRMGSVPLIQKEARTCNSF
jgi:hypothetical protein